MVRTGPHVYCVQCGTCLECDSEDPCFDMETQQSLPSSMHVHPKGPDVVQPYDRYDGPDTGNDIPGGGAI